MTQTTRLLFVFLSIWAISPSIVVQAASPVPSPEPSVQPKPLPAALPSPTLTLAVPTPQPAPTIPPAPPAAPPAAPPPPAPLHAAAATPVLDVDFDRFEDTTIYFKTGNGAPTAKPLKTGLYDLKYFGVLRPTGDDLGAPPYFFFSARPCKDCLQDTAVYAIRPYGGRPEAYVYPGKILEHKSGALVLESRAFYGRCLTRQKEAVYVVFQKERIDRKRGMQPSVLVAEPGQDHMDERLIERHLPRLQDTLRLVKSKACHEIDGRNRKMLSKPLDIRARQAPNGEGDDEDEDTKENQTDDDLSDPAN